MKKNTEIVCIVLFDENGDMLLQQRTNDDTYNPKNWALFGGGMNSGETKEAALRRETFEELGYTLTSPEHVTTHPYNAPNKKGMKHVFIERFNPEKKIQLGEGKGYAWFNSDQIKHLKMLPTDIESVNAAIEYISKK